MSLSKSKLSAFSLSEVLVAMLITIIVLGFSLFSLRYFQIYFQSFRDRIDQQNQLLRMEQFIWHDIHHFPSPKLSILDSSFVLSQPLNKAHYEFKNSEILRNDQLLLSKFDHLEFYYEGRLVEEGRFDAIALVVNSNSRSLHYFFSLPKSVQLYAP